MEEEHGKRGQFPTVLGTLTLLPSLLGSLSTSGPPPDPYGTGSNYTLNPLPLLAWVPCSPLPPSPP